MWRFAPCLPVFALASCAALTTIGFEVDLAEPRPRPVEGTALLDFKGVVHCHSLLSHDCSGTVAEIVEAATATRVDFVVMTDHQTDASIQDGARGVHGGVLFVVGAEVRTPLGTVLAFPLQRPLRRWQHPALLAKEAAAQGALTFVCHAEGWRTGFAVPGLAGAEIVNLHAGAKAGAAVGTIATALFLPMRSMLERICVRDPQVLAAWDRALENVHPFTPVGGDDAHANVRVFGPLGGTIGTYFEIFATLSTHVLAERLDEAALVEAFRAGRTYVSFDLFGDGSGFDFRAVTGDAILLPGSTVAADRRPTLRVRTPRPGRIRLLRDGAVEREATGSELVLDAAPAGVWRVEVETPDGDPWLFSSTIRVAAESPAAAPVPTSPTQSPSPE